MKPIQAEITTQKGKIKKIKLTPGSSSIINKDNGKIHTFKDSWLYPGFVDSHGHILALGQKLTALNFENCKSAEECVNKALKYSSYRGEWLIGRGWNQENWQDTRYPDKAMLDEAFPNIPVSFTRVDGHAVWVNSRALFIAGINKNTPEPQGGQIIRDSRDNPTGILIDNALNLISKQIPRLNENQIQDLILSADKELLRSGITEVHDMDVRPYLLPIFKELDNKGLLGIKIQSYVQAQQDEWIIKHLLPYRGKKLNIIGVKYYADGALGSSGAALLQPYSDDTGNKGLLLLNKEELISKSKKAVETGFDIAVHAIGDAANHLVLSAFEQLRNIGNDFKQSRLRIEHAQIIQQSDVNKFAEFKVYTSMQPIHCLSDAPMARKRIGNRVYNSYLWKTLSDSNAVIAGGSDFPIEDHAPLAGIDALVNRIPFGESIPWIETECISPEQAIEFYTKNAAILSGNDATRGTIEINKEADFTVLSEDLISIPKSQISKVDVIATIINGQIEYQKPN